MVMQGAAVSADELRRGKPSVLSIGCERFGNGVLDAL